MVLSSWRDVFYLIDSWYSIHQLSPSRLRTERESAHPPPTGEGDSYLCYLCVYCVYFSLCARFSCIACSAQRVVLISLPAPVLHFYSSDTLPAQMALHSRVLSIYISLLRFSTLRSTTTSAYNLTNLNNPSRRSYTPNRVQDDEAPKYTHMYRHLEDYRAANPGCKLTFTEKILYSHLAHEKFTKVERGTSCLELFPDRVFMQDASAQTALLQFILTGRCDTAVPTSIHCDHLIQAYKGQVPDLERSIKNNKEILDFLEQASRKYGIELWRPGSGIIHQIVLENYAVPGTLMLGTDSHTPNAGGLGTLAIGIGGADAVDGISGIAWELRAPKILGVHLYGKLQGWTRPKDVILYLVGRLGVEGATNYIVEYFGPGIENLSCTGMATICNMGAEMGATTSIFPFTDAMAKYLECTGRSRISEEAIKAKSAGFLAPDHDCEYDKVVEVNLSELEPHLNGPFSPDISTPISKFKEFIKSNGWEDKIEASLIGSCTNSSYEDISRSAYIASQATSKNIRPRSDLFVAFGSDRIHSTVERDGFKAEFIKAGALILANACGPCIGQWKRKDVEEDRSNSIVTSFNRNFRARNDGWSQTRNFLASPEIAIAMSYAGKLSFDPTKDTLVDRDGSPFKFKPLGDVDLPEGGFVESKPGMRSNTGGNPDPSTEITIDPKSSRLQILTPFPKWDGEEISGMRVLLKIEGKCTTDHISAAGKWLKYKGHLENISKNTLIGALNSFTGKVNLAVNEITGDFDTTPNVAWAYKRIEIPWIIVADTNYGEGSAREHAALQPRFLGCRLVLARSFARIHETNLKKQGILPVTFADPNDWNRIVPNCMVNTIGLGSLSRKPELELRFAPASSAPFTITVKHSMSANQILWFEAGSAINSINARHTR